MLAKITNRIQRKGFCGDQTLHDYLVLDTGNGEISLLRDIFPFDAREVEAEVELDYISIGNGWQYWPIQRAEVVK